jgi:hypothetical protein
MTNHTGAKPAWLNDQTETAWDRVKDAFQRDWQQTVSDFSGSDAKDLNQNVKDTLKQASGSQPIPDITVKSRPDTPMEAAAAHERQVKHDVKSAAKVAEASGKMSEERAHLATEVAEARAAEQKQEAKVDKEPKSADAASTQKADRARTAASEAEFKEKRLVQEAKESSEKAHQKADAENSQAEANATQRIASARLESDRLIQKSVDSIATEAAKRDAQAHHWEHVEPAARFGFAARTRPNGPSAWDHRVENDLRAEWNTMSMDGSWEQSRDHVRRGWDYGGRVDARPEVTGSLVPMLRKP